MPHCSFDRDWFSDASPIERHLYSVSLSEGPASRKKITQALRSPRQKRRSAGVLSGLAFSFEVPCRQALVSDIVNTVAITAVQAQGRVT